MCFAIPYKVQSVSDNAVIIEGGKKIRLGHELTCKTGDYVLVNGSVAVSVLSKMQGTKVRKAIKSLHMQS